MTRLFGKYIVQDNLMLSIQINLLFLFMIHRSLIHSNAEVVENSDKSAMDGSSKTEPPTEIMFRPQPSDGLKDQHSQTDSFLTAARLIRNGGNNKKNGGRQFHIIDHSVHQPAVSKPNPIPAEIILKAFSIRLVTNSRKTEKDKEVIPEQMTKKINQTCKKEFSAKKQGDIQMSKAGIVYCQVSGCRAACRQSRRFKAPLLPVIAEM